LIISEFSYYSSENSSGNKNLMGFGGRTENQKDRAAAYAKFVQRMASFPFILQTTWFQWSDEPASGRLLDGEDCNYGLVNTKGAPYTELIATAALINSKVNSIHGREK
jgi:hypothetical protein